LYRWDAVDLLFPFKSTLKTGHFLSSPSRHISACVPLFGNEKKVFYKINAKNDLDEVFYEIDEDLLNTNNRNDFTSLTFHQIKKPIKIYQFNKSITY
jgi:hypothetical protein